MKGLRFRLLLKISNKGRVLFYVLIITIIAFGSGLYLYFQLERLFELRKRIALFEKQILEIKKRLPVESDLVGNRDILIQKLQHEKQKYYSNEKIDIYKFSMIISGILNSEGLNIEKYQTVELGDYTYLEFSISGNSIGLAKFLERVSISDKYWFIPYLSIDARQGNGKIKAIFRITYGTANEKNY